ncbi:transposase [Streptomyces sp. NPDC000941]
MLPREEHELLQQRRAEQQTEEWKKRYHTRAGVEGSISQAVRRTGARRTRYRGHAKTSLAQVLTAAALNLYRLDAWWTGTPWARHESPTTNNSSSASRPDRPKTQIT